MGEIWGDFLGAIGGCSKKNRKKLLWNKSPFLYCYPFLQRTSRNDNEASKEKSSPSSDERCFDSDNETECRPNSDKELEEGLCGINKIIPVNLRKNEKIRLIEFQIFWEFDPGSDWMLTAWMRHASRTKQWACLLLSGERVSNTWIICLQLGNNGWKRPLIPNVVILGI